VIIISGYIYHGPETTFEQPRRVKEKKGHLSGEVQVSRIEGGWGSYSKKKKGKGGLVKKD